MKLYYAPGACSIGIHVLLEEIGKPYEVERVNLREGQQYTPEYIQVNPKSKVPALVRDDGSVLTEYPAIAYYLARSNPAAGLLPEDVDGQARAIEAMDYCVSTMHMQGFARMFRPENFSPDAAGHDAVKARGREIFEKGWALMDKALEGKEYLVGGRFSVADSALFYVTFWGAKRMQFQPPRNIAAFWDRMAARPAVQRVMQKEGVA